MIHAKDTFYIMLRDRLAALNPTRTIGLRGVTRPGILVEENELATDALLLDVFRLNWTALRVDANGPLPLVTMTCEVRYSTAGSAGNGGMDRGRMLAMMDAELSAMLRAEPRAVLKTNYTAGSGAVAMQTNVFWSDATFAPQILTADEIERVATVEVFGYEEAGE